MRLLIRRLPFGLFLVFALASCVLAAPEVTSDYTYYTIRGSTEAELQNQMDGMGKRGPNGKVYDAYTDWKIRWKCQYESDHRGCRIGSVTTTVHITHTLPKWLNCSNAAPRLQRKWSRYVDALKEHERGHSNIALHAAAAVESALKKLRPAKDCDRLKAAADALGEGIVDVFRANELRYEVGVELKLLRGPQL